MATVNVSEAARLAKTTRATIYKYIKNGKLSATSLPEGGYTIDTSEIMRVFGDIYSEDVPSVHVNTPELQRELDALREHLKAKDELIMAKEQHISDLQRSLQLLEYKVSDTLKTDNSHLEARIRELEVETARVKELEVEAARVKELEAELAREKGKGFFARLFRK